MKVGRAAERQECVSTSIALSPSAWAHGPMSGFGVHTRAGKTHGDTCVQTRSGEANMHGGVSQVGRDLLWWATAQTSQEFFLFFFSFIFLFLGQVHGFPSIIVKEIIFQVYTD